MKVFSFISETPLMERLTSHLTEKQTQLHHQVLGLGNAGEEKLSQIFIIIIINDFEDE